MATQDNMFINSIPESGLTPVQFGTKSSNYGGLAQNALHMLEQRKYKAAEASSAVDAAFSAIGNNLHQDPETATWFNNLKAEYTGRLEDMMNQEAYEDTIFEATKMAREVMSRPDVISRIKTNVQYENFKKSADSLLASGKINKDIYDQWDEENQYTFNPILDKQGNVIGGDDYKPTWMPVEQQDLTKAYLRVKELVGVEQGSSARAVYLDINGNETTNPKDNFWGLEYKTTSGYTRVPASKLKAAWDIVYDEMPEVKASLHQDWSNDLWKYNNAIKNGTEKDLYGSSIANSQGVVYDEDEYIRNKVYPIFDKMAYNHTHYDITNGDARKDYAQAMMNSSITGNPFVKPTTRMLSGLDNESKIVPVNEKFGNGLEYTTQVGANFTEVIGNLGGLAESVSRGMSMLNRTNPRYRSKDFLSRFNKLRGYYNSADYRSYAREAKALLEDNKAALTKDVYNDLYNKIRELEQNGNRFNSMLENVDKSKQNAVKFSAAINAGVDIPDIQNNPFATQYNRTRNALFSNKGTIYDNFTVSMTKKAYDTFINELKRNNPQMDESKLNALGIRISNKNGTMYISVGKNDVGVNYLVKELSNSSVRPNGTINNPITSVNPLTGDIMYIKGNVNTGVKYGNTDKNGRFVEHRTSSVVSNYFSTLNNIENKANQAFISSNFRFRTGQFITIPFSSQEAKDLNNAGVKSADVTAETKRDYTLYAQDIRAGLENYEVYTQDADGKPKILTRGEKLGLKSRLAASIQGNKASINGAYEPLNGECGIQVMEVINSNKKSEGNQSKIYTIIGIGNDAVKNAIMNDPTLSVVANGKRNKALGTAVKLVDGTYLNADSPIYEEEYCISTLTNDAEDDFFNLGKRQDEPNYKQLAETVAISTVITSGLQDQNLAAKRVQQIYNKLVNAYERAKQ